MKARLGVKTRLGTEFGRALMPLVAQTPGALAAVLSDDMGDAIDFAHDPDRISELDVQLLGAQIGQSVLRLHGTAVRHRLDDPAILVEATAAKFVAGAVADNYIVALLLDRRANVGLALAAFCETRSEIHELLA